MDRYTIDALPVFESLRNPVIDQMVTHSSVRSFDPERALPEGMVETMVTAAQSASTSSNFQSWSVVVVRDPERKAKLQELCDNQAFVGQAPLFLVFCADTYRHQHVTRKQGYDFGSNYLELLLVSMMDSALAVQNASLAAESVGLGCCMVGAIRNRAREVAELLELPPGVFATVGLAVGYPAKPRGAVRPRLPQAIVAHEERYSLEKLEDGLAAYDERMAGTGAYEGRRVRIEGVTPNPEQDTAYYSWLEHTARRMARGNEFRRDLAPFLREHGFVLE